MKYSPIEHHKYIEDWKRLLLEDTADIHSGNRQNRCFFFGISKTLLHHTMQTRSMPFIWSVAVSHLKEPQYLR